MANNFDNKKDVKEELKNVPEVPGEEAVEEEEENSAN